MTQGRKIKFRVWDNVDYMSAPFTLMDVQHIQTIFTSDCPVMQFTGLKDKNGKEIYEGDIVKDNFNHYWEVVYELGCFFVRREGFQSMEFYPEHCYPMFRLNNEMYSEVIGNIYENSEIITS